ncbi:hypothetical protein GQ457_18G021700 [Hibiscus cannabinus]
MVAKTNGFGDFCGVWDLSSENRFEKGKGENEGYPWVVTSAGNDCRRAHRRQQRRRAAVALRTMVARVSFERFCPVMRKDKMKKWVYPLCVAEPKDHLVYPDPNRRRPDPAERRI